MFESVCVCMYMYLHTYVCACVCMCRGQNRDQMLSVHIPSTLDMAIYKMCKGPCLTPKINDENEFSKLDSKPGLVVDI